MSNNQIDPEKWREVEESASPPPPGIDSYTWLEAEYWRRHGKQVTGIPSLLLILLALGTTIYVAFGEEIFGKVLGGVCCGVPLLIILVAVAF